MLNWKNNVNKNDLPNGNINLKISSLFEFEIRICIRILTSKRMLNGFLQSNGENHW